MFNHVGEMGRLVSDPELKTTPAGVTSAITRIRTETVRRISLMLSLGEVQRSLFAATSARGR